MYFIYCFVFVVVFGFYLVAQVDPSVLIFLSGWDVPSPVLRIDQVEVSADEAVLLQGAHTGQIGVILKQVQRLLLAISVKKIDWKLNFISFDIL